ncbi:MAG: hypothetical protein IPK85_24910 [Gemmatimonadetes bacterium]|nr:hypothetical protein [Gemmatimonadota bacterium]
MSTALATLRAQLATVVAPTPAVERTLATGILALDATLPGGGIPCGRLTEVAGASGSGATSLAHAIVARAIVDKQPVAYIDATRTLAPGDWAPLATTGLLWVIRPPTDGHGTWCADILLRSGAFRLVVLDDTTPIPRSIVIRLSRLAQDTQAALLVVHHQPAGRGLVGSALRLEMERRLRPRHERPAWRRVETRLARAAHGQSLTPVSTRSTDDAPPAHRTLHAFTCTITKGAGHDGPLAVEVTCAHDLPRRLCPNPAIPDRRGVAPRNRLGERAAPDAPGARRATPPPDGVGGTSLPYKRRFAEPDTSRESFLLDVTAGHRRQAADGGRQSTDAHRPPAQRAQHTSSSDR